MNRKINKENEGAVTSPVSVHKGKEYNVIIDADGEEWLTTEGAAAYLHLSVSRIYHIKNHLTHRKGNSPQSKVFFLKKRLFEDYFNINETRNMSKKRSLNEAVDMNKKGRFSKAVEYLIRKGIVKTQKDIAVRIGVSRPNVSSALAGKEGVLTDSFIRRFCDAFTEISYNWLLSGEGDMLLNVETNDINWKDTFMSKKERLNEAVKYLKYKGVIKTQVDIAVKMNAGRPSVSSALAGRESALTDNFIRRFCDAFTEISYKWLLRGEGDMLSKEETSEINWKDAFKDEGFLNELRKYCEQYIEGINGSEEDIDEIFNIIFKYDEKTEGLIVNKGKGKTERTKQIIYSDDNNKQSTEEDEVAIAQSIKLSLLLSLMLDNGLKMDKTNSSMFYGNTKKVAQIMHRITGIELQTCQDFLIYPCISSETPDDYITVLNNFLVKIGMKIRLKKGIIDVTT